MSETSIHGAKTMAVVHKMFDSFDVLSITTIDHGGTEEKISIFFDKRSRQRLAASIHAFNEAWELAEKTS